jgi:hypothetical protein
MKIKQSYIICWQSSDGGGVERKYFNKDFTENFLEINLKMKRNKN